MGTNGHFIFGGELLPPTECETGWAAGAVGTFREEEGPLPVLAIRPQFPARPARIPFTTLGPVHAVSNPFCATLYNVSQTRRACAMSHVGDVELKGCRGGFLTGTAVPELATDILLIYRL